MTPARGAFTLIEVLVVAAILAVLVGLLLPGVQKVREAAARARCVNNLRQVAAGFHAHHTARGHFPPGGSNTPPAGEACTGPGCRAAEWSWAYHLLPYIDHAEEYQNADPVAVQMTIIPAYYCPTRRPMRLYNNRAAIGYAANAGSLPDGRDGVVMRTPLGQIRLGEIVDGTANTVLVADKRLNLAAFGRSGDDNEGYATSGWDEDYEVYRLGSPPPVADESVPGVTAPFRMFGSSHPGVFNAAFADGAVRTVRYSVGATAWKRSCIRNDTVAGLPGDE